MHSENKEIIIVEDNGSETKHTLSDYFVSENNDNGFYHPMNADLSYVNNKSDNHDNYKFIAKRFIQSQKNKHDYHLKAIKDKVKEVESGKIKRITYHREGATTYDNRYKEVFACSLQLSLVLDTEIRLYLDGESNTRSLDEIADTLYHIMNFMSHTNGDPIYGIRQERLESGWVSQNISRVLDILLHVAKYDFSKNDNVPWNNIQDIRDTYEKNWSYFKDHQHWSTFGANWETTTLLGFKSMSIALEEPKYWNNRYEKIWNMMLTSYYFIKKDKVPEHPSVVFTRLANGNKDVGVERAKSLYMGKYSDESNNGSIAYDYYNTLHLWGSKYTWSQGIRTMDEARKKGVVLTQGNIGWGVGDKEDDYIIDGMVMEYTRDINHGGNGLDDLSGMIKLRLVQRESVSRDMLERVMKCGINYTRILTDNVDEIFIDKSESKKNLRQLYRDNFKQSMQKGLVGRKYGHIAQELCVEFGATDKHFNERNNEIINFYKSGASGSWSQMAWEASPIKQYLGLRN